MKKEGVGTGGRDTTNVAVFNFAGEILKYKQSWESMRTSILPMPVNQITAAGGRTAKKATGEGGKGMGSELENQVGCGKVNLPCLVVWGVGVRWREIAAAEGMIGVSPLGLL